MTKTNYKDSPEIDKQKFTEKKISNIMIEYLPDFIPQKNVDVLLVTGDVYIDHPSFGIAIIARILEKAGLSVCIVSQPEYNNKDFFKKLPEVNLFIGITAGNLDSIVGNYSSSRTPRKTNDYSVNGEVLFPDGSKRRPDRALIVYTNFIKSHYKNIPVVLGGLEASIRRFAHYDYIQQKLRKSVLIDSKADILVYGMGEKPLLEIVRRLKVEEGLFGIEGTVYRLKDRESVKTEILPGFLEIESDHEKLIDATLIVEKNMVNGKASGLIQDQGNNTKIIQFQPVTPLTTVELDDIYNLPYKKNYPDYCSSVKAWNMIKDSITIHRGCYGKCSFCAISSHQGANIIERSEESIIREARELTCKNFFKGTVTDLGGPTANMYGTSCKIGWCDNPSCLYPAICENLIIDKVKFKNLLTKVKSIDQINHVFVTSGIRYDLSLCKPEETEEIITNHTSGHLKIAPEHIDENILKLMRKPENSLFEKFIKFFEVIKKKYQLKFYILPYLIINFPGSSSKSIKELGEFLNKNNIRTSQYQDFTPVPGTLATAYFYSGKNEKKEPIDIPKPMVLNNKQREEFSRIMKNK